MSDRNERFKKLMWLSMIVNIFSIIVDIILVIYLLTKMF